MREMANGGGERIVREGVNNTHGLTTCNVGALKSHNLQIELTGHSTCQSCACLVIKRSKLGFRQKTDEVGTGVFAINPCSEYFFAVHSLA
jgi:hypothetical protein